MLLESGNKLEGKQIDMADKATGVAALPTWWPLVVSLLICGMLLGTTQSTLVNVARDVKELREDVKGLTQNMGDRWTGGNHKQFMSEEFMPLRDRVVQIEAQLSQVHPR